MRGARGGGPHGRWAKIFSAEEVRLRPTRRDDGRSVARRDCIGSRGDWLRYDTVDADVDVDGDRRTVHVALQGPVYLALPTR